MHKTIHQISTLLLLLLTCLTGSAQKLPVRWEELTASDWSKALEASSKTCILPIGILEKHGPLAPMGSDLIQVREWASRATQKEYAVVFPDYFYGQIYEAKHQPGAFALPSQLVLELLDATCQEISRNGFTRILIINGHGGNPNLLRFFIQTQLEKRRSYAVYLFEPTTDPAVAATIKKMHQSDMSQDMHAGERETSALLYLRPDLVKMDSAGLESGASQNRLSLPNVYTAIWWYADFPNHYAGDGGKATKELGKVITDATVEELVKTLKAVKADTKTLQLQNEFFDRVKKTENF
ncbi:MAG: creatininase family protein [Flavisolibacter sp.]